MMPNLPHMGITQYSAKHSIKGAHRMPTYNSNFELTVEDMDLIETSLRQTKAELAAQVDKTGDSAADTDETLRQIHDLLGRLHNQKVFYRPNQGAYVGG